MDTHSVLPHFRFRRRAKRHAGELMLAQRPDREATPRRDADLWTSGAMEALVHACALGLCVPPGVLRAYRDGGRDA